MKIVASIKCMLKNDSKRRSFTKLYKKSVKAVSAKRDGQQVVVSKKVTIKLACLAFGISKTCYRYQAKLEPENETIADKLIELTDDESDWGFGLCFDYFRKVNGFQWNHKRVYRVYCELALNLRIKPRR